MEEGRKIYVKKELDALEELLESKADLLNFL